MTIKLTYEDIANNWDKIKYAALAVSGVEKENEQKYVIHLLKNLYTDLYQCWFVVSEEWEQQGRNTKAVLITRIMKDAGDIKRILVDVMYGYIATTLEEKNNFMQTFLTWAKNIGCVSVVAYTDNPMVWRIMEKMGMREKFRLYEARAN